MGLGNSGARIEIRSDRVIKYAQNAVAQRRMCAILGNVVCPEVRGYQHDDDFGSYAMERLEEVPSKIPKRALLSRVRDLLIVDVWDRGPADTFPDLEWLSHLELWRLDHAPWIDSRDVMRCYYWQDKRDDKLPYCLTHGDPTLANVMWRNDRIVLIDPLPTRPGIPSLREVDVGKMLQSWAGWEIVKAAGRWSGGNTRMEGTPRIFTDSVSKDRLFAARCCLWAAVHCARIVQRGGNPASVLQWARRTSEYFVGELRTILE